MLTFAVHTNLIIFDVCASVVNYQILKSFSGVKAYLHDRASPSWIPTLELGQKEIKTPAADKASERYKRTSQ